MIKSVGIGSDICQLQWNANNRRYNISTSKLIKNTYQISFCYFETLKRPSNPPLSENKVPNN